LQQAADPHMIFVHVVLESIIPQIALQIAQSCSVQVVMALAMVLLTTIAPVF